MDYDESELTPDIQKIIKKAKERVLKSDSGYWSEYRRRGYSEIIKNPYNHEDIVKAANEKTANLTVQQKT